MIVQFDGGDERRAVRVSITIKDKSGQGETESTRNEQSKDGTTVVHSSVDPQPLLFPDVVRWFSAHNFSPEVRRGRAIGVWGMHVTWHFTLL